MGNPVWRQTYSIPSPSRAGFPRAFGEDFEGSHKGGEHPAPIDVSHEQNRGPGKGGHRHVHDVVVLEIDLPWTARAFDDHRVRLGG